MRDTPLLLGRIGVVAVLFTAGCAVPKPAEQWLKIKSEHFANRGVAKRPAEVADEVPVEDDEAGEATIAAKLNGPDPEFEATHPLIDDFIKRFSTRSRKSFGHALERSGKFVPDMIPLLEEEGVPPELAYLPLIESAFRTNARSPAGAVGPWQFVRSTGQRYGLRIDYYVDERRDPIKSTKAAARYLSTLYDMFGSWQLSLAAYNTGEVRIARVMDRRGADNFWDLMENGYLHPETRAFVPQFLAALRIARDPEGHGFETPTWESFEYDLVEIERSLSLRRIAEMTGTQLADIQSLNPALIRNVTPPDGYPVRIPSGMQGSFAVAYADYLRQGGKDPYLASAVPVPSGGYRVRPGDTPSTIARRFRVSVPALMRANGWKDPRRIHVGQAVRVPGAEMEAPITTASTSGKYRVRRGDTPSSIAQRFGISVTALMRANGWKDAKRVRVGEVARVPGGKASAASTAQSATSTASATTYQVRKGDTPETIARRYGVSVRELMRANGWKDARKIRVGQKARIPGPVAAAAGATVVSAAGTAGPPATAATAAQITYRIRRGDTPAIIASRFGVAVEDLMAANDWNDPRKIRAGELAVIPLPDSDGTAVRLASRAHLERDKLN